MRRFQLPSGWTLRLTYGERPDDWREAGDVVAEFIPPGDRGTLVPSAVSQTRCGGGPTLRVGPAAYLSTKPMVPAPTGQPHNLG
jgi:hypothetical protein